MLMIEPSLPIDTKQLLLFEEVYRTRSVSRAAERLGLAQPTVSIWLRELRRRFDDVLFVRTAQGMLPTPKADALIGIVRQALDSLRRLDEPGVQFDPATVRRTFRIAMTDASHISILPRLLARLRREAPLAQVEAIPIGRDIAQRLEMAEVDLAIGYTPELNTGIYQQALYSQDFICLVSARHPRIGERLSLADFQGEAHIGIVQPGSIIAELDNALARQDVRRNVVLRVPSCLGLNALVAASDLIAIVPRQIGQTLARSGLSKALECPVALPAVMVRQHWHARFHEDGANRWLRRIAAQLFEKE